MESLAPVILVLIFVIVGIIGSRRSASKAFITKPKELVSFETTGSIGDVFHAAQLYARMARMKVEDVDEVAGRIVLGQTSGAFHNGFWLPIYVHEIPGMPTVVEVGIKSKTFQLSLALNLIRDKAMRELEAVHQDADFSLLKLNP